MACKCAWRHHDEYSRSMDLDVLVLILLCFGDGSTSLYLYSQNITNQSLPSNLNFMLNTNLTVNQMVTWTSSNTTIKCINKSYLTFLRYKWRHLLSEIQPLLVSILRIVTIERFWATKVWSKIYTEREIEISYLSK